MEADRLLRDPLQSFLRIATSFDYKNGGTLKWGLDLR